MSWQAVPPFPCWPHLPTNTTAGARFAGAFPSTRVPGTLWREKGQLYQCDSRDSHHAHEPCERNGGESSPRAGAVY